MAQPNLLTFYDAIAAARRFLGHTGSMAAESIRQAVQEAYREVWLAGPRRWRLREGRVQLRQPYSTGTVTYTHSGGTYDRQLVLSDGTWPTDVADWYVKIGDAVHRIAERKSNTIVTLDPLMNPGSEASISGASYTAFPGYYILPADFVAIEKLLPEDGWQETAPMPLNEIIARWRWNDSTGTVRRYWVGEAPDKYGSKALFVDPPSDADETLDFTYVRRPRPLRYTGHDAADTQGTISVSGNSVTGTNTAFAAPMEGAIIRIGSDSTNIPTGLDGLHPFYDERSIVSVSNATSLTLDAASSGSGVKYCVTDPIDLPEDQHNYFLALLRAKIAVIRNMDNKNEYLALAEMARSQARAASQALRQPRVAGCRFTGYAASRWPQDFDTSLQS